MVQTPSCSFEKAHVAAAEKVLGRVDAGLHEEEVCRGVGNVWLSLIQFTAHEICMLTQSLVHLLRV